MHVVLACLRPTEAGAVCRRGPRRAGAAGRAAGRRRVARRHRSTRPRRKGASSRIPRAPGHTSHAGRTPRPRPALIRPTALIRPSPPPSSGPRSRLRPTQQVLQAHPQYPTVPHAPVMARCLAQCLLPGLPSGLHIKALEVYTLVFERISVRRQERDEDDGRVKVHAITRLHWSSPALTRPRPLSSALTRPRPASPALARPHPPSPNPHPPSSALTRPRTPSPAAARPPRGAGPVQHRPLPALPARQHRRPRTAPWDPSAAPLVADGPGLTRPPPFFPRPPPPFPPNPTHPSSLATRDPHPRSRSCSRFTTASCCRWGRRSCQARRR